MKTSMGTLCVELLPNLDVLGICHPAAYTLFYGWGKFCSISSGDSADHAMSYRNVAPQCPNYMMWNMISQLWLVKL